MRWVGTTIDSPGERGPLVWIISNTSLAARCPIVVGSCAMAVSPGSSSAANSMSSKLTRATRCCFPAARSARRIPIDTAFRPPMNAVGGEATVSKCDVMAVASSIVEASRRSKASSGDILHSTRPARNPSRRASMGADRSSPRNAICLCPKAGKMQHGTLYRLEVVGDDEGDVHARGRPIDQNYRETSLHQC